MEPRNDYERFRILGCYFPGARLSHHLPDLTPYFSLPSLTCRKKMNTGNYYIALHGIVPYIDRLSTHIITGDVDSVIADSGYATKKHLRLAVMSKKLNPSIVTLIVDAMKAQGDNISDAMDFCHGERAASLLIKLGADPSHRSCFSEDNRGNFDMEHLRGLGESFLQHRAMYGAFYTRVLAGGRFPKWIQEWFNECGRDLYYPMIKKNKDALMDACIEWHGNLIEKKGMAYDNNHYNFVSGFSSYRKYLPIRLLYHRLASTDEDDDVALGYLAPMGRDKAVSYVERKRAKTEDQLYKALDVLKKRGGVDQRLVDFIRFSMEHAFVLI